MRYAAVTTRMNTKGTATGAWTPQERSEAWAEPAGTQVAGQTPVMEDAENGGKQTGVAGTTPATPEEHAKDDMA